MVEEINTALATSTAMEKLQLNYKTITLDDHHKMSWTEVL